MKITNTVVVFLITVLLASSAECFTASGFSNPFGVAVDSKLNYVYVSNINGDPKKQDDNGFISRLKGDGSIDKIRFIDGASSKRLTLSAPKGMAVINGRIYVTDIDKLHAFDQPTGKFLFDVNFGGLPVQHFYDVTLGPDKSLYVADGPANVIYRVDIERQHEVTIFTKDEALGQPHGIAWFPARQVFAVAGWSSGKVTAYDRSGQRQTYPSVLLRTLEGITADNEGNLYVSSSGLSAIYRIAANFALHSFKLAMKAPMGVAFSTAGNEVVAASFATGKVESISTTDVGKEQAGTTDYVQPAPLPTPKKAEQKKDEKQDKGTTKKPAEAKTSKKPATKKDTTQKKAEPAKASKPKTEQKK